MIIGEAIQKQHLNNKLPSMGGAAGRGSAGSHGGMNFSWEIGNRKRKRKRKPCLASHRRSASL